ncbi:MAG: hypothetical protein RIC56_00620 [Pseudomonadales bacterium]
MVFDDVGRHVAQAGGFDRAAVPLGMYLAWLANHQLLSAAFSERAATLITRLRFREITGSELLVAGCGGVLDAAHLSPEGEAFTTRYFPGFYAEFRREFGADPYAVEDDWDHYDRMARRLTGAFMAFRGRRAAPAGQTSRGQWLWNRLKFWR